MLISSIWQSRPVGSPKSNARGSSGVWGDVSHVQPNKGYTPEFKNLVVFIDMVPNNRKFLSNSRFGDIFRSSVVTMREELYMKDANHFVQHAWMRIKRFHAFCGPVNVNCMLQ